MRLFKKGWPAFCKHCGGQVIREVVRFKEKYDERTGRDTSIYRERYRCEFYFKRGLYHYYEWGVRVPAP